jgi:hypothetical protein
MHASAILGCGIYCPRGPRTRAQRRCPLRGHTALGNRPTLAGLRSSRYPKLTTLSYRLPLSGAGRGFLAARATVSPRTDLAPDSRSARAQPSSVAPAVNTSSTSKTRLLSTWLPGRVAKAPRTDAQRSSKLSTCLSGRGLVLINKTDLCGKPSFLHVRGEQAGLGQNYLCQSLREPSAKRRHLLPLQQEDRFHQRSVADPVATSPLECVRFLLASPANERLTFPPASITQAPARKPRTSFLRAPRMNPGILRKSARGRNAPKACRKSCTLREKPR